MNLPFFKKHSPATRREYLFALEISHALVKSAVWSVINGHPQVISQGLPVSWDDQTDQSLLNAVDTCLSDASAKLDATGKTEVSRIILGLPADWLVGEKIDPSWLKLLKTVLQKLSLKAVGFVITSDAAVRYLQSRDGVPLTAILVGFYPQYLEITLVRLGKVDGIHLIKRSSQLVSDITEGLSRFPQVNLLPSRILLYDSGSDLETIKQNLLSHPWQSGSSRLPFLHFPKIEALPADFTIRAIALAGGNEVAQALGIISLPDSSPPSQEHPASPQTSPSDLGFVSEVDVLETSPPPPAPPPVHPPLVPEIREDQLPQRVSPRPRFTLPRLSFLPLVIIVLVLLVTGLGLAYWFLPTAVVTLTVNPKQLEHQFVLTADTQSASVNSDSAIIPARFVEVTSSGDKTVSTTGSKIIGDKAAGSVTVINGTASTKKFSAGTLLTSPAGLKFTFDADVTIASASGTADPNSYQPGKATVKVTASQIGTESNLSAGTQFKVGSFSSLDFVAKNEAALSGGSSRQAQVVSKDDLNNLRSELTSQLKNDAQNQLSSQIPSSDNLISPSLQVTVVSEEFDHKVDEVADTLTLKLSARAKGLVLAKSDLDGLVSSQLRPLVPPNYTISGSPQSSYTVKNSVSAKTQLSVNVAASLLPTYAADQIVPHLVGKSPDAAYSYLSGLSGIARVNFSFSPPLPPPLRYLPHISDRINLTVVPAQ